MTKNEQNRVVAWRLKIIRQANELPRGVAQTCRHFGLSRKTFYKWQARYKSHGDAGLCNRSRAPLHFPRATPRNVVSKILYLRERYRFGAARISSYLHRFHGMDVARSTAHRILIRYGMRRLPANQKRQRTGRPWHRYEKPQPGHRLQIDVKFLERIAGSRKRLYQFTAIDDCTRIRVLKIYDACNQKSAISFVDEVIRRLPLSARHPDGQRRRVPVQLPLAPGTAGRPARLHPSQNASTKRQGRALTSCGRAGVLPAAR